MLLLAVFSSKLNTALAFGDGGARIIFSGRMAGAAVFEFEDDVGRES